MASPTPPLALSPPSLAVLQTRMPAQPNNSQGQPQGRSQPDAKNPGPVPAALMAGGRGRLVDILV